jgi:hypothetical protein
MRKKAAEATGESCMEADAAARILDHLCLPVVIWVILAPFWAWDGACADMVFQMANKVAAEYNDAVEVIQLAQPRKRGFAMTDRNESGCWFCGKVDKFLIYEEEFDTYVHVDCIRKALEDGEKTGRKVTEAKVMSYLLGDGI